MQYIIYHDKSHEAVEDNIAEIIWQKSCTGMKGVQLDGKKYFFSAIAKIIKEKDYYQQYPDKIPEKPRREFVDIYGASGNQQIRQPITQAGELMKQGFVKYHLKQNCTLENIEQKYIIFKTQI